MRGLREALGLTEPENDLDPGTQMAIALGATKHPSQIYGGTVPVAVVARRRATNRRARAARRVSRGRR